MYFSTTMKFHDSEIYFPKGISVEAKIPTCFTDNVSIDANLIK